MNKPRFFKDAEDGLRGAGILRDQQREARTDAPASELRIAWALIDPRPLIREALVHMMEGAGSPLVIGAASVQDLLARVAGSDLHMHLIMLHVGDGLISQERFCREFVLLRRGMMDVPVVVISDQIDLDGISHALRAGARGYIPTSWSSPAVMQALRHVQGGGVHVPEEELSGLFQASRNPAYAGNPQRPCRNRRFTPRQLEVLQLLRQGKPNKIIAYELDMQQSTVKVHVREIMKKLKVSNRTEAAFRAGQLLDDHDASGVEELIGPAG